MDVELLDAIRGVADQDSRLQLLEPARAEEIQGRVCAAFGFPASAKWWWEHLSGNALKIAYGNDEGLARLTEILSGTNATLHLFVTDDEEPPWPCVSGSASALVGMLGEQRFFEYFVVDDTMQWIVFDTHHNELIVLGEGP